MSNLQRLALVVAVLMGATVLSGGCAYMKNRGNDALDIFDIGVTFTKTPQVAVYAGFQSLLGAGYSGIDEGYMVGIGQRQVGVMKMRYEAAGAVLEGYENYQYADEGDLPPAPEDPHGVGLGMLQYEPPKSGMRFFQCPKFAHLLFIGVNVNCKISELVDFLAGWTTVDIANDDVHGKAASK